MICIQCGCKTTVLETRHKYGSLVLRRRRGCGQCGYKFFTYELDDGLAKTLTKHLLPHIKSIRKKQKLHARNEQIINMMNKNEKHTVIADMFGLSENMVSTIARRAGIPAYQNNTRTKG
jgi:transcriptional regulator NrdR family protein